MIHDKAMFAPIWELAFLNGHGPRVAESGLTLIAGHPYSTPVRGLEAQEGNSGRKGRSSGRSAGPPCSGYFPIVMPLTKMLSSTAIPLKVGPVS